MVFSKSVFASLVKDKRNHPLPRSLHRRCIHLSVYRHRRRCRLRHRRRLRVSRRLHRRRRPVRCRRLHHHRRRHRRRPHHRCRLPHAAQCFAARGCGTNPVVAKRARCRRLSGRGINPAVAGESVVADSVMAYIPATDVREKRRTDMHTSEQTVPSTDGTGITTTYIMDGEPVYWLRRIQCNSAPSLMKRGRGGGFSYRCLGGLRRGAGHEESEAE